jgi:hypothetical protein
MFTAVSLAAIITFMTPQITAPQPTTPAGCVTAAQEFRIGRPRELSAVHRQELAATGARETPQQSRRWAELMRSTVELERQAMLKACAAQFDPARVAVTDLADLAALFSEIKQPDQERAAIGRALAASGLPANDRAKILLQAISTGLRETKGDARNARLETYVDELDLLPTSVFDQQFSAHTRMNGYYRADDIDAGMIKHSTWIIDKAAAFDAAKRIKYESFVISAFVNLAQVRAGQGQNDEAVTLLRRALKEWGDQPRRAQWVQLELDRYLLVGTAAAPIVAPRWLNAPAGTTSLDLKGKVTLLGFSAHWCDSCRESYPGINRLRAQFASKGLQVVLVTRLYGDFRSERSLAAEAEVERDRAYFAEHHLDVPIAVGNRVDIKVENGSTIYVPAPDPNDTAYRVATAQQIRPPSDAANPPAYQVFGIPQIHLIDRQGRIRLIMIGYDDANEGKLAKMIETLLAQ